MTLLLKCKIRQNYILLPTDTIHYIQRATQWRQLPEAQIPVVGAIQSRTGWIPVVDLALLLEKVPTTPRASTRMVVSAGVNGQLYALLCEQVVEIIKIDANQSGNFQGLFELNGDICRLWNPADLDLTSYNCRSIGGSL